MKKSFYNLISVTFLFSVFLLIGCTDDEGTGPTTRSSNTENTGDGTRDNTTGNDSTGGLGQDDNGTTSNDNSSENDSTESSSSPYAAMEKRAHDLVNEYRASKGLPALTLVENISSVCREHSESMAAINVLSHDGVNGRYDALQITVGWTLIGENVAVNGGFSDPEQKAVTGWIGSPGHEKNMTGNFTKTGMGVAKSANGSYYFTQIFIK